MEFKQMLKNQYIFYKGYYVLRYMLPARILGNKWDQMEIKRKFKKAFGYEIDLMHPKTLNEKIQWLKLNERDSFHTYCADKLASRKIWEKYGRDGLIPLLFCTYDWRKITYENCPDIPFIIKCNSGSGLYQIIRDKNTVDFKELQKKCQNWLVRGKTYYAFSQERQYRDIRPCILIEQLLLDSNGRIPNDYKLHYINGELQFVYCSIDREGQNYRSIYSPQWERMNMEWVAPKDHHGMCGENIPCPKTFLQMQKIGGVIAQNFKYVRIDFYDVDGKLYYGEITLYHGSGYNTFEPEWYDLYYGEKLKL